VLARLVRGLVRGLSAAILIAGVVGYAVINTSRDYAPRWHVDPSRVELRGTPNEFLAAPRGTTSGRANMETLLYPESPRTLLARFDTIARAHPRTSVVAGTLDSLIITYVQRSRFIGFPDYLTVKAVALESGSALIVYSRSRYGQSDLGVNRARVEAWLAALGESGSAELIPDKSVPRHQTPGQPSDSSRHAGLFTDMSHRASTRREPMTRQAVLPISTRWPLLSVQ
jgi:uncharacterized protein (DUF1499 family)